MRRAVRPALVLTLLVAAVGVLRTSAAPPPQLLALLRDALAAPQATLDQGGLEAAMLAAVALAAWAVVCWLTLAVLLTLLGSAPGRAGRCGGVAARLLVPATARRVAAAALGVGMLAGLAGVAHASPPPSPPSPPPVADLDLDWPMGGATRGAPASPGPSAPPARPPGVAQEADAGAAPSGAAPSSAAPSGAAPSRAQAAVVVRPGDCLWSISARRLPGHATPSRIAQAWPAWWQANRAVIGDDPDLIQPGQRLLPPGTTQSDRRTS